MLMAASVLLLVGVTTRGVAADRFVSVYGDDAGNDCLASTEPCATVVYALTQAASGDVVKATRGRYFEELVIDYSTTLTLSGAWSVDFTSRDPARYPSILQGDATVGSDLVVVSASTGDVIDLTVDGFSVSRGNINVMATANDNASLTLRFQNCAVKTSGHRAFHVLGQGTSTVDLTLSNCTISKNRSGDDILKFGNGNGSSLNVTMNDVVLERNRPIQFGGPLYAVGAGTGGVMNIVANNVTIAKNGAGGMSIFSNLPGSLDADLTNMQVRNNRDAGMDIGGGGATVTLANAIIAKNRQTYLSQAAGLAVSSSAVNIVNSTIRGNKSSCCEYTGYTGGVLVENSAVVDMSNTIIWGNKTDRFEGPADDLTIDTGTVNVDHSDIGPSVSGTFNDLGGNISTDPLFERLAHLMAASPAIDAGTCTGAPATDFEGDPRPSGGGCDMGADEFVP